MANVVGLRGHPIPPGSEPDAEVVDVLEKYLEQARNGHIRGVAFVLFSSNDELITGWSGDADNRMLLSGASTLVYRLAKELNNE